MPGMLISIYTTGLMPKPEFGMGTDCARKPEVGGGAGASRDGDGVAARWRCACVARVFAFSAAKSWMNRAALQIGAGSCPGRYRDWIRARSRRRALAPGGMKMW
jgi:hypothetical protein